MLTESNPLTFTGTPAEVFGNPQSEKTKAFLRKEQF